MRTPAPTRRFAVAGALLSPLLAGCGATNAPNLYTLAPRPGSPLDRGKTTVAVKQVELATYLDRPQVVRYSDPYKLNLSEYERWGEGLSEMVTRVMVENLSQRLPQAQIFATSGPLSLPAATVLAIEIDHFEPNLSGVIVLDARWSAGPSLKADRLHAERVLATPSASTINAQIAAMSDALGALADRIAAGLPA